MNNKNKLGVLVCLVGLMSVLLANAQSAFKADGLVESTAGGFKFPDGSVQKTSAVSGGPYVVGGTGPAGGFVFHVTADGLHGLEAAPVDQSTGVTWGCSGTDVIPATANSSLGTGASNTADMLRGCTAFGTSAPLAANYVSPSGYYDWYLPSRDELDLMRLNLYVPFIGGFASGTYWSSSEIDANGAYQQYFPTGSQVSGNNKGSPNRVRAVRAF